MPLFACFSRSPDCTSSSTTTAHRTHTDRDTTEQTTLNRTEIPMRNTRGEFTTTPKTAGTARQREGGISILSLAEWPHAPRPPPSSCHSEGSAPTSASPPAATATSSRTAPHCRALLLIRPLPCRRSTGPPWPCSPVQAKHTPAHQKLSAAAGQPLVAQFHADHSGARAAHLLQKL